MKTKALLRQVRRAGGRLKRQKGSHKIFVMPDNETLCVPHSGAHREADVNLVREFKARYGTGL